MDNQEQILNSSPVPPKPTDTVLKTYNLFEALKMVVEGKRITKLEWADQNIYGLLTDGILRIMLKDGLHDWIISDGDLTGNDFIVLP